MKRLEEQIRPSKIAKREDGQTIQHPSLFNLPKILFSSSFIRRSLFEKVSLARIIVCITKARLALSLKDRAFTTFSLFFSLDLFSFSFHPLQIKAAAVISTQSRWSVRGWRKGNGNFPREEWSYVET